MKILVAGLFLGFSLMLHAEVEEGFTSLLNGKDLAGWKVVGGKGEFRYENGEIIGKGRKLRANSFLRSEKVYRNFDFRFEMKFDTLNGNSGMMFRAAQREECGRVFGYQCEHDNKKRSWTAGLFDEDRRKWLVPMKSNAEQMAAFTAQGERLFKWNGWNAVRILCEGKRIQIFLNGELRANFTDEDPEHSTAEGFFGMQVHSGKATDVRWRNLRIKELP